MANNIIRRTWKQGGLVNIEDLRGSAFQAESGGHTFLISGVDIDGNPLALSGTPAGVLLRADGQDVTLTCSVSDGVVSATLPANAYVVPGRVGITIFLTSDGQKTAIYAAVGSVATTSTGTVAPPAGSDVVDLVNAIATAVATIPASYTDLMAAVAPTYSTSALYAVGSYAWYSGKLYRCTTAITSGETWTSAHWTQANLGSDVSDLKSALSQTMFEIVDINGNVLPIIKELGGLNTNTGKESDSSDGTRLRTKYIQCEPGTEYTLKFSFASPVTMSSVYLLYYSSESDTGFISSTSKNPNAGDTTFTTPSTAKYVRLRAAGTNMTPDNVGFSITKDGSVIEDIQNRTLKYITMSESIAEDDYSELAANLPGNTYCWITSSWFSDMSAITSGSYWLFTYASKTEYTSFAMQYALNPSTGEAWIRKRSNNSGWSWEDWSLMGDPVNTPLWKGVLAANSNLNDVDPLTIYGLNSLGNYTNKPNLLTSGYLFTVAYNSGIKTQIAVDLTANNVYSRRKNASNEWTAWTSGIHDVTAKYFAFGDSTTWGQIGVMEGTTGQQSKYNYPNCVGKLLHMEVHNQAVKGEGLITDEETIYSRIENLDMTGAKLITVGWAYNDRGAWAAINFGTASDTEEDNTYIGKYYKIMKTFQTKCPDAKVILVTGYGRTNGTARQGDIPPVKPTLVNQFTGTYTFLNGPVSAKTMYDTMEAMCNLHGWSCINQAKGTVFNRYNVNTVIGDQIHPTNEGYLLYGNFLAARIASMYGNIAEW